jgi:hypothetical protein
MSTGKRYDFLLKQIKDREAGGESPGSSDQELEAADIDEQTLESRVETEESRVLIPEHASQESRIEGEEISGAESRVETEESRVESLDREDQDSRVKKKDATTRESGVESLDYSALDEAIEEARKKPKLGVYSPIVAAMLRYKARTTPRYSMGSEIKTIVEEALKGAYPELYEEVQKRMNT